jgi:hypothetical protein
MFRTSRMRGVLAEYRSVKSDISASILASRLRALFAFMTILSVWFYSAADFIEDWFPGPSAHDLIYRAAEEAEASRICGRGMALLMTSTAGGLSAGFSRRALILEFRGDCWRGSRLAD